MNPITRYRWAIEDSRAWRKDGDRRFRCPYFPIWKEMVELALGPGNEDNGISMDESFRNCSDFVKWCDEQGGLAHRAVALYAPNPDNKVYGADTVSLIPIPLDRLIRGLGGKTYINGRGGRNKVILDLHERDEHGKRRAAHYICQVEDSRDGAKEAHIALIEKRGELITAAIKQAKADGDMALAKNLLKWRPIILRGHSPDSITEYVTEFGRTWEDQNFGNSRGAQGEPPKSAKQRREEAEKAAEEAQRAAEEEETAKVREEMERLNKMTHTEWILSLGKKLEEESR